jgi:hypothetical protein
MLLTREFGDMARAVEDQPGPILAGHALGFLLALVLIRSLPWGMAIGECFPTEPAHHGELSTYPPGAETGKTKTESTPSTFRRVRRWFHDRVAVLLRLLKR